MAARKGSQGDWIRVASMIEPELTAAPRGRRLEVLKRAAEQYELKPSTIHRMVRAYRYAITRSKTVGLEVNQVAAPVVCIELLERMERRGQSTSIGFRGRVLSGEISFQELRRIDRASKNNTIPPARVETFNQSKTVSLEAFLAELSPYLFDHGALSSKINVNRPRFSQVARNLSVDLEIRDESGMIAVFLSPQCVFSESRDKAIIEQLSKAVMATFFYEKVVYLSWSKKESSLAEGYLPKEDRADHSVLKRLKIVTFRSVSQDGDNGKDLRTRH